MRRKLKVPLVLVDRSLRATVTAFLDVGYPAMGAAVFFGEWVDRDRTAKAVIATDLFVFWMRAFSVHCLFLSGVSLASKRSAVRTTIK